MQELNNGTENIIVSAMSDKNCTALFFAEYAVLSLQDKYVGALISKMEN